MSWKDYAHIPLLPVAAHTLIIYLFLVFMLRFVNRRQLGQLNVIDLVIIIVLGSAIETAMVNGNTTLPAGLVCAGVLMFLNRSLALTLGRSRRLSHVLGGGPILLIHNGHFVEEHLKRHGLTRADVMEALREREYSDVSHIAFAVLETDGKINVVPMRARTHQTKDDIRQLAPEHAPTAEAPLPAADSETDADTNSETKPR